jgi:hypothetical protein
LALGVGLGTFKFETWRVLTPSVAQAAGTLVWGPYLQAATTSAITIAWATTTNSASEVRYKIGGGSESVAAATAQRITRSGATAPYNDFYIQSAKLAGLTASTLYSYRVLTGGVELASSTFSTARSTSETAFSFVVIGDSGTATSNQVGVAQRMAQLNPEFVLHCGDIIGYPTNKQGTVYQEWAVKFFDIYQSLFNHIPVYPAIGNHDFQDFPEGLTPYLNVFYLPENVSVAADKELYYSFDYGNAHFTVLDVYAPYTVGSKQYTWLQQDLANTSQFWKIVWMQTGPYSSNAWSGGIPGGSESSANKNIRQVLVPLFQQYNVDIVFAGDQHIYERSVSWAKTSDPTDIGAPAGTNQGGIVYVITGGGGAPLGSVQTGTNRGPWSVNGAMFQAFHATKISINGATLAGEAYDRVGGGLPAPFDTFMIDRSFEVANGLLSGSVTPETAGTGATYTFQVTYKNSLNQAPAKTTLVLDNQVIAMSKVSGTYTAGAVYQCQVGSLGFGTHHFYFDFGTGYRFPATGTLAKPVVNDPPIVPTPISPANGSTGVGLSTTFSWSDGDPNAGAGDQVKYDFYLGTSTLPTSPTASNLTTTSYTPAAGSLSNSTAYIWKVVAKDSMGATSTPASNWSFTTVAAGQHAPSAPGSPSPANGATNIDRVVTLSWSPSIDIDGDPVTYDVTIQGVVVATGLTTTSFSPNNLVYSANYSWNVTARSVGGPTVGPTWSFATKPDLPPVLSSPSASPQPNGVSSTVAFSVVYSDPYGRPAREAKIFIDDVPYAMTPAAAISGVGLAQLETAVSVTSGIPYTYTAPLAGGHHAYRFEFINTTGGIAKQPEAGDYDVKTVYTISLPIAKH